MQWLLIRILIRNSLLAKDRKCFVEHQLMVKPHQSERENESDVAPLVTYIIQFTCHTKQKAIFWVQNPFGHDIASEIALALVWLDH